MNIWFSIDKVVKEGHNTEMNEMENVRQIFLLFSKVVLNNTCFYRL